MSIARNIRFKLEKALKRSPVVLLIGARQTGKTTLMKKIAKDKGYTYISFDDIRMLTAAQNDPMGFIAQIEGQVIFNEIQRVPDLFLAIKHAVDNERIAGQFVLTGSANPLLLLNLGDSLAGRMEILTMFPFSQGELAGKKETFIDTVWGKKGLMGLKTESLSQQEYYQKIIVGGYPVIQNMESEDRDAWFNSYVTAVLQKDIVDIASIENISVIPRLLSIIASSSSSLLNASSISRASGVPLTTLKRYFVLLETLFMLYFHQTWSTKLIKRITKSPKPYLVDSGLSAWLQMITIEKMQAPLASMGHLIENFVVSELQKQLTWNRHITKLYHFRTITGIEVDIVLEAADGSIIGIEIKGASNVTPKDIKGLQYLKEHTKSKWHRGIILYLGDQAIPFSEDIIALPLSALWSF